MVNSINPKSVPMHKNPLPTAALHRGVLATSSIMGKEVETGTFPDTKEAQVALAFDHMRAILAEAGATPQDVVKVTLYFENKGDRKLANPHWLAMYPDSEYRPARHSHQIELPEGCCMKIEFLAVVGE